MTKVDDCETSVYSVEDCNKKMQATRKFNPKKFINLNKSRSHTQDHNKINVISAHHTHHTATQRNQTRVRRSCRNLTLPGCMQLRAHNKQKIQYKAHLNILRNKNISNRAGTHTHKKNALAI